MAEKNQPEYSVVIPTYRRGEALIRTLEQVFACGATEVIVVDQTPEHAPSIAARLAGFVRNEGLRHIFQKNPRIPEAMNRGLLEAGGELVLFLDDDVEFARGLFDAHIRCHKERPRAGAVVGRVLQPGERAVPLSPGEEFRFNSTEPCAIRRAMAGNLSVKRDAALAVGGFDENFTGAAYGFESDFARRLWDAGFEVWFEPEAEIHHLRVSSGGTRAWGNHLRTCSSAHSVGAYYELLLLHKESLRALGACLRRWVRAWSTRFHLTHPWFIPAVWIAETAGFFQAARRFRSGRKLLRAPSCYAQGATTGSSLPPGPIRP